MGKKYLSIYKHVVKSKVRLSGGRYKSTNKDLADLWQARVLPSSKRKEGHVSYHNTEREAAIAVDKHLISIGREPVNILKRKTE